MITRPIPIDCIDDLHQIRDEMTVIWCALSSGNVDKHSTKAVAHHVNGIENRLAGILKRMGEPA